MPCILAYGILLIDLELSRNLEAVYDLLVTQRQQHLQFFTLLVI